MPYAKGACRGCGGTPADGKSRCAKCLKARRAEERRRREERRRSKRCLTCGAPAKEDRRYCAEHLAYYAARSFTAARAKKKRAKSA